MRGSVLPAVLSLAIIDSINPASITGALYLAGIRTEAAPEAGSSSPSPPLIAVALAHSRITSLVMQPAPGSDADTTDSGQRRRAPRQLGSPQAWCVHALRFAPEGLTMGCVRSPVS